MKKIVQRMCMGCNEKKDKRELIRIVYNKQGEILIDETGNLSGRGAYLCKSEKCLDKAIKAKKFERIFETKINDQIYENIRGVIIDSSKSQENKQ